MPPRPHIRCRKCGDTNTIICINDVVVKLDSDKLYGHANPRFKCTTCEHDGTQPTTVFVPAIPREFVTAQKPPPVSDDVDPEWDPAEERESRRAMQRAKAGIRQQDPVRRSRR